MNSTNNMTNGNEWQTAGKTKSTKPKQQRQQSTTDNNSTNGYASGNSGHSYDHSASANQNGMYNGGGNKRGGRQSSASSYGNGRTNNYSNAQFSRPTSSKEDALNKRKLLEKEAKNMVKLDANIEHTGRLFDEEISKSRGRIRQAFDEIRKQLDERERMILEDLDRCKADGHQLLQRQEQRGKELKEGASHMSTLTDRQVDDLKKQIRNFTSDRHFEQELGGTLRFRCEQDRLIDMVKNFGEVIAIGGGPGVVNEYQKHSSMSSLVSSADGDGAHFGTGKPVSEISVGGIMMKSDSMDADQLVELTRSLRENLKLQGIAEDILPEVCGGMLSSVSMPPARRRPQAQRGGGVGNRGGNQRR